MPYVFSVVYSTRMQPVIDPAKFWRSVDTTGDCWLWTRSLSTHGYGQQWHNGKLLRSHRIAWLLTHGPIPHGQCVCHTCDNPKCCNPRHLFLGTQRENLRDMVAKGRNHVPPAGSWIGTRNVRAKLTPDAVRAIRADYAAGASLRKLSERFGVAHTAIASVLKRRTWAHVD